MYSHLFTLGHTHTHRLTRESMCSSIHRHTHAQTNTPSMQLSKACAERTHTHILAFGQAGLHMSPHKPTGTHPPTCMRMSPASGSIAPTSSGVSSSPSAPGTAIPTPPAAGPPAGVATARRASHVPAACKVGFKRQPNSWMLRVPAPCEQQGRVREPCMEHHASRHTCHVHTHTPVHAHAQCSTHNAHPGLHTDLSRRTHLNQAMALAPHLRPATLAVYALRNAATTPPRPTWGLLTIPKQCTHMHKPHPHHAHRRHQTPRPPGAWTPRPPTRRASPAHCSTACPLRTALPRGLRRQGPLPPPQPRRTPAGTYRWVKQGIKLRLF